MKRNRQDVFYNKRTWLNDPFSSSSGSIVCYHGFNEEETEEKPYELLFCEISDCHVKARLHKTVFESRKRFTDKMIRLRNELDAFINYLKEHEVDEN